ncbi:hypothetical protein DFH06DRAFT_1484845 [Mycena polygramma]|nr:hypothetical protein DFH06DRAFT_1484845 [Mycena polygramma]
MVRVETTAPRDILGNILTRAHNHGRYVSPQYVYPSTHSCFCSFKSGAPPTAPAASTSPQGRSRSRESGVDEDEYPETEGENGERSD